MELQNIYFNEPRLKMSHASRFLIRLISNSFYVILLAATIIFLTSNIKQLFLIGVLLCLFLGDRILHYGQAERSLIGVMRYLPRLKRREEQNQQLSANSADYLTPSSFSLIERAMDKSLLIGGNFYLHLLESLTPLPAVKEILLRMDVSIDEFNKKIKEISELKENNEQKKSQAELLEKIEILAKSAFVSAFNSQNRFINPRDLFSGLGKANDNAINQIFTYFSINSDDLEKAAIFSRFRLGFFKKLPTTLGGFIHQSKRIRHRAMNRAWTARPTPLLDSVSADFTDMAREKEIGFLIGHKNEYDRLIDILSRPTKSNVLLIGEPGSGKETLVAALAFGIVKDEVPQNIFDKRLISLSIGNLISGASPAEITSRLNKVVEEIVAAENIILYIPDIHNLAKTSGNGLMNAADVLLPIINNADFPIIGATYPKEYKQYIEQLSDFSNTFEIIRIEEISEDDAIRLLTYDSVILEKKYKIIISFGAIKNAVILAHKYFRQNLLPSSAQDLLKEALSAAINNRKKTLKADDVITIAEKKVNIPIRQADEKEAEKLLNLESIIHKKLINQEEAVKAVSQALREYRSGLSRQNGPIAVFLFVGPTGVGKTELSKILARIQFGSEQAMARFDMSEYQTKESISRFIGSPNGNIGGTLTDAVTQKPYSLVLLDEFEKAHPDILNLFLQVFDDGRLTDSLGRTVDFTNTIIIATSNSHSNFIKEQIETGNTILKISEELKKKLTEYFRPELLNRFSNIVVFKNLSPADTKAIANLQLKSLAENLEETHTIKLIFEESAIGKIAELGYDPVFGARPLRGVISEKIKSVLAEKILKQEIVKGNTIRISLENGDFVFEQI